MPEINYHVPTNPKKPKRGIIVLSILDILNTALFGTCLFSLLSGACGVDPEVVCRAFWYILLLVTTGLSTVLLAIGIGFLYFYKISTFMRWIMLGLPCLTILSFSILWLLWS
ncbi:hypothetical protein [Herpetosiphon llansteffanensis]|uniref:hypothetical protein n=1 Tax=Herpetosiphon llansteffanensis TaxID=2094568 RepID=UPI000F51A582|nr:hypothetical protein [Herpetosiphon llansteffanensis]